MERAAIIRNNLLFFREGLFFLCFFFSFFFFSSFFLSLLIFNNKQITFNTKNNMTTTTITTKFIKKENFTQQSEIHSFGSVFVISKNMRLDAVVMLSKISLTKAALINLTTGNVYGTVIKPANKDYVFYDELDQMIPYSYVKAILCSRFEATANYISAEDPIESIEQAANT